MQRQLTVVKSDGTTEGYLYTKVIGTISRALDSAGRADVFLAEQLTEAVTYYLYYQQNSRNVSSGEILYIIKAVLTSTGYDDAAVVLSQHHLQRRLRRNRTEVVFADAQELAEAAAQGYSDIEQHRETWDKSRIIKDLVSERSMDLQMARAVASMVEDTVFNMDISSVPAGLIQQLVLNQTALVLRAERQLQMA